MYHQIQGLFSFLFKIILSVYFSETITEDKVRSLLFHKQYLTIAEVIENFLPETENLQTKEIKDGITQKLSTTLNRLNIEEQMMNEKICIKLK